MTLVQIAVVTVATLIILLIALAGYAYTQIRLLSLPIPLTLPVLITLLPLLTTLTTTYLTRLLRPSNLPTYTTLLTLITTLETALATWAITYLPASCGLEEKWAALYRAKDADSIRRIQDRWACCGFNSVKDRAWPFPHGKDGEEFDAGQCKRIWGREIACGQAWGEEERRMAGVLVGVAVAVFVVKVAILSTQMRSTAWTRPAWMRFLGGTEPGDLEDSRGGRESERLLIGEGARVEEEYHDEEGDVDGTLRGTDADADAEGVNRPRLEPSGLTGDGAQWRDFTGLKVRGANSTDPKRIAALPSINHKVAGRKSNSREIPCPSTKQRLAWNENPFVLRTTSVSASPANNPGPWHEEASVQLTCDNYPLPPWPYHPEFIHHPVRARNSDIARGARDNIPLATTQPGARHIPPVPGISMAPA
ncbi:hypothetical protein V501_06512 [Pseudogymnoascus sp. VKM F-4519 (FW-2642)]|nr:hypothetical protein V501_06512 [Pseudogymnoascus sp. VKM F-4519 (FW-2642)]